MSQRRDLEIEALLLTLGAVWRTFPELRLGQLLTDCIGNNTEFEMEGGPALLCDMFNVSDQEMELAIINFGNKFLKGGVDGEIPCLNSNLQAAKKKDSEAYSNSKSVKVRSSKYSLPASRRKTKRLSLKA